MYKIRNKVYSEVGYILIGNRKKGYQFEGEISDFTEEKITIDDMRIENNYAFYSGIVQYIGNNPTYEKMKADMIKRRYSNDDQIAIMLNGDEEAMNRMQQWREWSSTIAHKIMELVHSHDDH